MAFQLLLKRKHKKPKSSKLKHTIVCFDPGEVNFFYTVIVNQQVKCYGQVTKAFKTISIEALDGYRLQIQHILNTYKPKQIVIERMMTRRFLNKMVEGVNLMLGILYEKAALLNIPIKLVTAASWKLSIKKLLDLKELYKYAKKQHKLPAHPIDSMLTGRYHLSNNNYKPQDKQWIMKNLPRLIQQA